jgi:serine phosphatase RsbU (regulator of sigma subunit)
VVNVMTLRARLLVSFFAVSVLPLAVVVLSSYRSSVRALQQAAEAEGRSAAAEMSQRMEIVTADLSHRVDQLWDLPEGTAPASASGAAGAPGMPRPEKLAELLGATALLLERVEFIPAPPPGPQLPPGPVSPPVPPGPTDPVVSAAAEHPAAGPPEPMPPAAPAPQPRQRAATGSRSEAAAPARTPAPAMSGGGSHRTAGTAPPQAPAGRSTPTTVTAAPGAAKAGRPAAGGARGDAKSGPAATSAAGLEAAQARSRPRTEKIVIDVQKLIEEAVGGTARSGNGDLPAWARVLGAGLATGLKVGASAMAEGLKIGAAELERQAARRTMRSTVLSKGALDLDVHRAGRFVGRINAHLNLERVLEAVLIRARRDEREVPFAVSADGRVFTASRADRKVLDSLGVADLRRQSGTARAGQDGNWLVVMRRDDSGITFGIARPLGDSLAALRRTAARNLAAGVFVILLAAIGIVPLSRGLTRDLRALTQGAERIAAGDLRARVSVRSRDEVGTLAAAFNRMAESVEAHQKLVVEQERLHRELELCRRIQIEMLPREALRLGFAEVKGVSIPAREVGGDFFNYFALPGGEVAVLVGDVSGKGVGAALLMANVQATLRARLPLEPDLASLVDAIDRDVDERTPGGVYVTLFVGIFDAASRRLRYVNAGHHPQFVLRVAGGLERLPSAGLPVGLYAGHGYAEREIHLDEGDLLFFYTDGLVETENERGEMFGTERLEAILIAEHEGEIDAVLERIEDRVRAFRGGAEPFDDATMMALRVGREMEAVVQGAAGRVASANAT